MNKLFVVSMGPGNPGLITHEAMKVCESCDVLIGANRYLELFPGKESIAFASPLSDSLKIAREQMQSGKRCAILLSGDGAFFGMLKMVKEEFDENEIDFSPGISSFQYMMSKLQMCWEDSAFLSAHGRESTGLSERLNEELIEHKKLIILCSGENSPDKIAGLINERIRDRINVYVGERLSYADERIRKLSVSETVSASFDKLSVMAVILEDE